MAPAQILSTCAVILSIAACVPIASAPDGGPGLVGSDGGCEPGRTVLEGEVRNARDLGGTPVATGTVACGAVLRGAAPTQLSASGCAEFEAIGIRTVIDLRTPGERSAAPAAACVERLARVVSAPMPIPYRVSPEDYLADLDATASVRAAFEVLADPEAYPVFFHCTYGRDRSGVLAALVLGVLGATRADMLAEYELTRDAGLSITPESLGAVLDEIDRRGGVEAVLAAAGVPKASLDTLRARALSP